MYLRLSVQLRPLGVQLSHLLHRVVCYLAFFLELEEYPVEFVVNGGRGVLLQSAVASRGGNVVVDFVEVLLSGEDYGSIAFVGREEFELFFLLFQGLQGSPLFMVHVVGGLVSLVVIGGEGFNDLVGGREFHSFWERLQGVLDPRCEVGSGVLGGVRDELES